MCHNENSLTATLFLDFPKDASSPRPEVCIVFNALGMDHVLETMRDENLLGQSGNVGNRAAGENPIISFDEVGLNTQVLNTQSSRDY